MELQVINCSNFYNHGDHKNSVVNSLDLIEGIQHKYMKYRFNNILKFNVTDDNNKGTGKKVKKIRKKRIKELDNKVTKKSQLHRSTETAAIKFDFKQQL